jgi:hypothetical protein
MGGNNQYQKQMDQREQIEKEYLEPHRKELDLLSSQLEELQITNFSSNDIEELVGMREALFTFQEQIHNDSLRKEYNYDLHLRLQKELPELRSYLTAFIMGKDAKSCPHCKSSLRIVSGSLELFQGSKYSFEQETLLRKDLQEKEKQYKHLNELKIKIDSFPEERIELNQDEIKERIIELEQLQNQHKQTTKTRETISQKFVLTRDNINIKKLKEQYDILSQIQEVPMPSQPKTQLQNNVEQGKKRDQEIVIMTKLVKDTHAKISDIKDQLNKLPLIESIKPLQTDLSLCIDSLEKSRQESFHLIKKIEEQKKIEAELEAKRIAEENVVKTPKKYLRLFSVDEGCGHCIRQDQILLGSDWKIYNGTEKDNQDKIPYHGIKESAKDLVVKSDLWEKYKAKSVPFWQLIEDGKVVKTYSGVLTLPELREFYLNLKTGENHNNPDCTCENCKCGSTCKCD